MSQAKSLKSMLLDRTKSSKKTKDENLDDTWSPRKETPFSDRMLRTSELKEKCKILNRIFDNFREMSPDDIVKTESLSLTAYKDAQIESTFNAVGILLSNIKEKIRPFAQIDPKFMQIWNEACQVYIFQ